MPQLNISLETLADAIKKLNHHDKETFLILLSGSSNILLKRKREIESKRLKTVSRTEVFGV